MLRLSRRDTKVLELDDHQMFVNHELDEVDKEGRDS